jgi:quercetin dioxygenase-like cupin family protein
VSKTTFVIAAALLLLPGLAEASGKAGKGSATVVPAGAANWADAPGRDGVKIAVLEGTPAKGAGHFLIKLPAGMAAPAHFHTPDHHVFVVSGTLVLGIDGKDTSLPAGSYFSFLGKKRHTTRCEAGADCVLFVDARGKWDLVPVDAAK